MRSTTDDLTKELRLFHKACVPFKMVINAEKDRYVRIRDSLRALKASDMTPEIAQLVISLMQNNVGNPSLGLAATKNPDRTPNPDKQKYISDQYQSMPPKK